MSAGPMSLHEICQAALAAGRCGYCGAVDREPCTHPDAWHAAGVHLRRFGQAALAGTLTGADLTVIVRATFGPVQPDAVVYDEPPAGDDTVVSGGPRMLP